ncbi:MAG: T9SS type A sorting domain-containing protein [Bacteroidales bacterium]|jgi:hypothetical protein|nr:T9SS type A sorting domain-containing protein [Bacteroidales bacterium]
MKKLLLVPVLLILLPFISFTQNSWQWAFTEGGLYNEIISTIDCDVEGNIYVAGAFQESFDFFGELLISEGDYDVFVACFNPQGNLLWVEQGGGNFEDGPRDIYVDDQYLYVTGGFIEQATFGDETLQSAGARDMFLLKYDLAGNLQWALSGGGVTDDIGHSVTADDEGDIYLVGDINYIATFGDITVPYYGFSDIFIAKYNTLGVCQWANSAGGPIYENGSSIDVQDNHVFIGGGFNQEAIFGDTSVISMDFVDIFIAHYLTDGSFVEVASAGGSNNENITCLAVDSDLNVYVGGWFIVDITIGNSTFYSSSTDAFLTKYLPGTGFNWSQQIGGAGIDEVMDLYCDEDDQLIISGVFENAVTIGTTELVSDGFDDGFVGKFDASGTFDWVFQLGGSGSLRVNGCTVDTSGNYYVGGDFLEELIIGNNTFNPVANYDLFIARLGEGGTNIDESYHFNSLQTQVHPNPFATSITIDYELKQPEKITLIIYDHLGKPVFQTKEIQPQSKQQLIWNAEGYANGIYYYRLKVSDEVANGKIVKVR